jgi:NAD(P)-dependent dehydrogenase (short-subunit alcohol dehydrogenase family)
MLPQIVSRYVRCVQGLAAELAPNVRVNCVAPGIVPTHFASALVANEASVSILGTMFSCCFS